MYRIAFFCNFKLAEAASILEEEFPSTAKPIICVFTRESFLIVVTIIF